MEFFHLQEYFEAVRAYSCIGVMVYYNQPADEVRAVVTRLHETMAKVDLTRVVEVLERHCANGRAMENCVYQWLNIDLKLLTERMNGDENCFPEADEQFAVVYCFAVDMTKILQEAEARVAERLEAERNDCDNKKAFSKYNKFRAGFYGDIKLREFVTRHIVDGVSLEVALRRLDYLHNRTKGNDSYAIANVRDEIEKKAAAPEQVKPEPTALTEQATKQREPLTQETAKGNAATNDVVTKVDAERLGSYFNAKFKGVGNNYNYFDDMVKDIQAIKLAKELAMIAVMIYDCRRYFIQRPSTFAAWLREFFEMIGRDCPKDHHKNKYTPNERIKRTFHYLS